MRSGAAAPEFEVAVRARTAMILAAGRGERMRPLTDTIPKPLLCVRGKPLIEYHIERLAAAGIERIVINVAWLGGLIRDYLGDGARHGVTIHYSDETTQVLETAGGIFRALPHLVPGPFLVVNGDIFTEFPFERLDLGEAQDAHLVLVPNPPHHPRGDFGLVDGAPTPGDLAGPPPPAAQARVAEPRYTFAGIALYAAPFFDGCSDGVFPLKPLLVRAMVAKRCTAELFTGVWEDVGTPQRLRALNAGLE